MRRRRPLDRTTAVVRDASLVVIACEDKYAVKQYFDFFRSTRIQFKILPTDDGKSAPEHLLARLDEYMQEFDIGPGDLFWLVCDCDHWIEPGHIKNFTRVLQKCRQKEIRVAVSNPCFDLWLLLHFAEFPPENKLTCEQVATKIRALLGGYDKTRVYNLSIDDEKVRAAVKRSAANQPCASEIPDRPQTRVHQIIEELVNRGVISVGQT